MRLDRVAGVNARLEAIVMKALASEPDDRHDSAGALGDDLRRFLEERRQRGAAGQARS